MPTDEELGHVRMPPDTPLGKDLEARAQLMRLGDHFDEVVADLRTLTAELGDELRRMDDGVAMALRFASEVLHLLERRGVIVRTDVQEIFRQTTGHPNQERPAGIQSRSLSRRRRTASERFRAIARGAVVDIQAIRRALERDESERKDDGTPQEP